MHEQCCTQAKRKYQEVLAEKQNLEADRAELQQKYAQKAQQARKLQARVTQCAAPGYLHEANIRLGLTAQTSLNGQCQASTLLLCRTCSPRCKRRTRRCGQAPGMVAGLPLEGVTSTVQALRHWAAH